MRPSRLLPVLLDAEDMRRRRAAYQARLPHHPGRAHAAQAWAEGNLDELATG